MHVGRIEPPGGEGNKNLNRIKVAKGTTPSFQETEETTPSSDVEGSQSSSFHPYSCQVPSQTTDTTSLNCAQALAYADADSDDSRWVSFWDGFAQGVRSQPFHQSFSSTQLETLGNIPKQGCEIQGESSTKRFVGQKEFGSHLPVPGQLQTFENVSSHLSNLGHNLTRKSHEQEVAAAHDFLNSLQSPHEHFITQNDLQVQLSNAERGHSLKLDSEINFNIEENPLDKFLPEEWSNTTFVGSSTNLNCIKVAEETFPYFQDTTPNSDVEGSQSSSFHPYSYQVPLQPIDTASLDSAQASAYGDFESDNSFSLGGSTSWVANYEDNFLDWDSLLEDRDQEVAAYEDNFLDWDSLLEDRGQEVGSQPFHLSFSSSQPDTLGNIPKQGHEILGEHSTKRCGEQQEFSSDLLIPGELQTSEDDSSLLSNWPTDQKLYSDPLHDLISRFHEQEVAHNDYLQPPLVHPNMQNDLLAQLSNAELMCEIVRTYCIYCMRILADEVLRAANMLHISLIPHLKQVYHLQGMTSTQSVDVASESVMDYTDEFTNYEIFKSKEELIQWTHEVGRKNGFVIVIKRSDSGDGGQKARISFCCERGGHYRDTKKNKEDKKEKQLRNGDKKKCGCPFTLKGHKLDSADHWTLKVICGMHNHPVTEPRKRYSYAGRLSKEENLLLNDMSQRMVRPKDILGALKNRDGSNFSTIKHIYNARHRHKVIETAKKSKMQQLLSKLSEHKYIAWHRSFDNSGTIEDLFWAHPVCIDLLHAFPCVLLLDCTHNRSNHSLLEIVGMTSTKMTFAIAFAYLKSEQEDNYTWALERLRSLMDDDALPTVILSDKELALVNVVERVFPTAEHLLCRWRISRDVLTNCKSFFAIDEIREKFRISWELVVLSSNEDEFTTHLNTLKQEFSSYPQAIEYVTNAWLNNYKEQFVSAWTNKIMHFGNVKIERRESSYPRLKRQLCSNQGIFEKFWLDIHKFLEQQHRDIKASLKESLTVVLEQFEHAEFEELQGFISIDALHMVLNESERANSIGVDASKCGCIIRRTHGLPCAHEIAKFKTESRPIPLKSIDSYWRKLDLVPLSKKQKAKLDYEQVFNLAAKSFDKTNDDIKSIEIGNTQSTSLMEPEAKKEIHDHSSSKGQVKIKRQWKGKVYRNKKLKSNTFINFFPIGLQLYIYHIEDVAADGNCGFRAIADLMGFGENEWLQVRKDLLNELNSNLEHYSLLFETDGTNEKVTELIHALSFFESCPGYDRWMTMPDMGHLIASAYDVVLFQLSSQQCLTFLPLRSSPMPIDSRTEIAIGLVNNNHFVEVFLSSDHLVPPIASNWYKFRYSCAEGWETVYISRIEHFKKIIGRDVATDEIIIDSSSED